MPSCPTCLAPQPDGVDSCARCGAYAVGSPVMLTVALTPDEAPGVARFDSRFPPTVPPAGPAVTPMPDRAPLTVAPTVVSQPAGGVPSGASPSGSVAAVVITPPQPAAAAVGVKLRVIRGLRMNAEYPVYPGRNVVGRFADRPVDIDLTGVEPDGQVWSSRRHAVLTLDRGLLVVEDLNSLNGTWVNGTRIRAGTALPLQSGDVIQIGVAQLRVEIEPA